MFGKDIFLYRITPTRIRTKKGKYDDVIQVLKEIKQDARDQSNAQQMAIEKFDKIVNILKVEGSNLSAKQTLSGKKKIR